MRLPGLVRYLCAPRSQEHLGQTGSLRTQPELPHPPSGNSTSMPKTRGISGRFLHPHKDASAEMQIGVGRHHTRENPRTIHSRNGHPKSPAGAPIKGWYPHSSTSIRHRKGTWGEHQAHEADTRPNTHTSNINHWCGQQQQEPQAVWKLAALMPHASARHTVQRAAGATRRITGARYAARAAAA